MHVVPVEDLAEGDHIEIDHPAIVGEATALRNLDLSYADQGVIKGLPLRPSFVAVEARSGGKTRLLWLLDSEPTPAQREAIARGLEQYDIEVVPADDVIPLDDATWRGSHDQGQSAGVYPLADVLNAYGR